jgi:O-glycosyl hydrolase
MHSRDDLSCTRGYELDFLRNARARNPQIKTYGLSWGAPHWVNNGTFFGPEMVHYQTQWVACMAKEGVSMDYLGVYNERYWGGAEYIKSLRAGLDAAGFAATQIIIPDGGYDAKIMADAATDAAFNASFAGVGLHYPCDKPAPEVQAGGKLFWASEECAGRRALQLLPRARASHRLHEAPPAPLPPFPTAAGGRSPIGRALPTGGIFSCRTMSE